jgi:Ca2+-binding EF-hand superfamily protein
MSTKIAAAMLACVLALGASAPALAHGDHTAALNALRERFKAADANSDGGVTRAEWDAHLKSRFAGYDKNSDGRLATEEIDGLLAALHGAIGGGDLGAARAELLKAYDKDGDSAISQAEYVGGGLARFDAWDLDKNGTVDKSEQEAELTRMAG